MTSSWTIGLTFDGTVLKGVHRWQCFPLTKVQKYGKRFHVKKSSCKKTLAQQTCEIRIVWNQVPYDRVDWYNYHFVYVIPHYTKWAILITLKLHVLCCYFWLLWNLFDNKKYTRLGHEWLIVLNISSLSSLLSLLVYIYHHCYNCYSYHHHFIVAIIIVSSLSSSLLLLLLS